MNHLAPRQGVFAIMLLVSFLLHLLLLVFSSEAYQYQYRTNKGEKIVEQLSREALTALSNQDRISLSVLANRYQADGDVAKLVISDKDKHTLVQTGQAKTQTGIVIDKPFINNNAVIGHAIITMKSPSKGEIVSDQWLFILGSAILHFFLWLIYGYLARPTNEQLEAIGEKVQQRLSLARGNPPTHPHHAATAEGMVQAESESETAEPTGKTTIADFLHRRKHTNDPASTLGQTLTATTMPHQPADSISPRTHSSAADSKSSTAPSEPHNYATAAYSPHQQAAMYIEFFDEFRLLDRIAPEVAHPYFQLCDELLNRAIHHLQTPCDRLIYRYLKDISIDCVKGFDHQGVILTISGKSEELPLASVLIGKLVIMLNQVVYEKHRELSRFALPISIGVSLDDQVADLSRLMTSHAKEDGLLMLYPKPMVRTLNNQVALKNLPHPTSVAEREMVWYQGLSEHLMNELIDCRDEILTSSHRQWH